MSRLAGNYLGSPRRPRWHPQFDYQCIWILTVIKKLTLELYLDGSAFHGTLHICLDDLYLDFKCLQKANSRTVSGDRSLLDGLCTKKCPKETIDLEFSKKLIIELYLDGSRRARTDGRTDGRTKSTTFALQKQAPKTKLPIEN